MGYRTDVRLIITKQGYKELKNYINDNEYLKELLEETDINKKVKDLVVLGWSDLKGNSVDGILDFTSELYEKNMSYRYVGIGENIDDIQEEAYTSEKDEKKYIPYPSITRTFADEYTNKELELYSKDYNKQKENDLEESV